MVADIGGNSIDEATRRMMSFLLDQSLAKEYNFVGRNGKIEFRSLKLFEVLYGMHTCYKANIIWTNLHLITCIGCSPERLRASLLIQYQSVNTCEVIPHPTPQQSDVRHLLT